MRKEKSMCNSELLSIYWGLDGKSISTIRSMIEQYHECIVLSKNVAIHNGIKDIITEFELDVPVKKASYVTKVGTFVSKSDMHTDELNDAVRKGIIYRIQFPIGTSKVDAVVVRKADASSILSKASVNCTDAIKKLDWLFNVLKIPKEFNVGDIDKIDNIADSEIFEAIVVLVRAYAEMQGVTNCVKGGLSSSTVDKLMATLQAAEIREYLK